MVSGERAEGPVEYEYGLPLLPRFYLHFPQPEIIGIEQLMLVDSEKDFNEYLKMLPSRYVEELKCMKEEYYSIRPSKRNVVIDIYIQRNEELRRELDME